MGCCPVPAYKIGGEQLLLMCPPHPQGCHQGMGPPLTLAQGHKFLEAPHSTPSKTSPFTPSQSHRRLQAPSGASIHSHPGKAAAPAGTWHRELLRGPGRCISTHSQHTDIG